MAKSGPSVFHGIEPNAKVDTMDLNGFFLTAFCLVDDALKQHLAPGTSSSKGLRPSAPTARYSPWR